MSAYTEYSRTLIRQFWDYVDSNHDAYAELLEVAKRSDTRPPVFRPPFMERNVLTPPEASSEQRLAVEATLPRKERHRYFGSMRSSQALAQSVFGNLIAAGKLHMLSGLESDEGFPAFFEDAGEASVQLEYTVSYLGEPRPTSIDFWVEGSRRVAVECKLSESEFGTCSRPSLRTKDANYDRDYCNGNYTRQQGRDSRCSLTEIGVRYWSYIPEILYWDNATEMHPCPLRDTYQLVRNILAACVTPDHRVDTKQNHALVIYDARNPAFLGGGKANRQWLTVKRSLRRSETLRSCSWQRLISHISSDPDLIWLVDGLNEKYDFSQQLS